MADRVTFHSLLDSARAGHDGEVKILSDAMEDAFAQAAKACNNAGGKSSVTLKIGFESIGKDQIGITVDVKPVLPQRAGRPAVAFVDRRGDLVNDDPGQQRLPLESVERDSDAA